MLIEGVPVQFLPVHNSLLEEALREATDTTYDGIPIRVLRAEHLVAICLLTGREKDRERVRLLREQATLNHGLLLEVLERYGLTEKWNGWTA